MTKEEAWKFIRTSPKTRFCPGPGFLLNLYTGDITDDSEELVEPFTTQVVVLEHYGELPWLFEQHDLIFVQDDIDKTLDVKKEVHYDRFPGLNVTFSTNTFRYRGFTNEQIIEMREALIEKRKNIAECQAKKKERE
jgi:hypothetical protein